MLDHEQEIRFAAARRQAIARDFYRLNQQQQEAVLTTQGPLLTNLIFDMVIPYEYDKEKQNDLREEFARRLRDKNDRYHAVITMERSYVASAAE